MVSTGGIGGELMLNWRGEAIQPTFQFFSPFATVFSRSLLTVCFLISTSDLQVSGYYRTSLPLQFGTSTFSNCELKLSNEEILFLFGMIKNDESN